MLNGARENGDERFEESDPVKHEQKRGEILGAALRCFIRDGFRGASTTDICAEAGISPGHLYHYFPSKVAIIEAMIDMGLARAAAHFEKILGGPRRDRGTARRHRGK